MIVIARWLGTPITAVNVRAEYLDGRSIVGHSIRLVLVDVLGIELKLIWDEAW